MNVDLYQAFASSLSRQLQVFGSHQEDGYQASGCAGPGHQLTLLWPSVLYTPHEMTTSSSHSLSLTITGSSICRRPFAKSQGTETDSGGEPPPGNSTSIAIPYIRQCRHESLLEFQELHNQLPRQNRRGMQTRGRVD